MGYYGKLEEKAKAQKLRSKGYSYGEIQKQINISKDTVSRWCRDIVLSSQQSAKLIQNRLNGATKGRIKGAKIQQDRRIEQTKVLFNTGVKKVSKLTRRDRFLLSARSAQEKAGFMSLLEETTTAKRSIS